MRSWDLSSNITAQRSHSAGMIMIMVTEMHELDATHGVQTAVLICLGIVCPSLVSMSSPAISCFCRSTVAPVQMTSMPVSSGTCLLDMFYKVPEVLNHCICAWRTRGDGIRVLRLVCKDMVKPASSAIRWSSFQVGEGAWPSPQQLTHLLRYTLLTSVDVTILIWTGG